MGWVRFPLGGGAVNSRGPSAMRPGEFALASGVKYRPNSDQLHNDLTYGEFNFRPGDAQVYATDWFGPFYLSFENAPTDWLMIICNRQPIFTDPQSRTLIYFAKANGTGGWQENSYKLGDNVGNQTGITAASIAHWGDRYYLATDQGCAEIAPPTGTGPPTVTRLGMLAPEPRLDFVGDTSNVVSDTGSWTTAIDTNNCDIVPDDVFFFILTEYDSTTGQESAPVLMSSTTGSGWWGSTTKYPYAQASAAGEHPVITFPTDFYGNGDTWRAYFVYLGTAQSTISYNDINNVCRNVWQNGSPPIGASLLNKDGQTEFAAGDVVSFNSISKNVVNNPLPVLAIDNARLIYNANRHPNTSTVCAVWNDSLILADTGFRRADSSLFTTYNSIIGVPSTNETYGVRGEDAIPSIMRYSPPGEPWNQPVPYFLNFASEREDAIKRLLVVNDRLLVLCDQAVHTVRYLPFNNLLASQQGRVKDTVTTNVGLASPKAAVKVETPRGEMAVWLSRRGLEWSDGTGWDDACPDFTIPPDATEDEISKAVMVTLPSEYRVDLYLGTKLYSFYYHPSHIKGGAMKMLGPTELDKRYFGACEYRGTVYRFDGVNLEWTGAGTSGGTGSVYTGYVYGDNPFKDVVIEDLGLTHSAVSGTISMRCDGAVEGRALQVGSSTSLLNPDIEETGSSGIAQRGNYVRFRLDVTGTEDWAVGPMWIQGDEESGGRG